MAHRMSTIRASVLYPKTDISNLPLELHAEILESLDHWIHVLAASQVCQSWRRLLAKRSQLPSFYQSVHLVHPILNSPTGFNRFYQPVIFGDPPPQPVGPPTNRRVKNPSPLTQYDHGRHLLLQDCTIAYRRCPITGTPELRINPSKFMGFYDPHSLAYFPDGFRKPEFFDIRFLSLLSSPISIDPRPTVEMTLLDIEYKRMCGQTTLALLGSDGKSLSLGSVFDQILEKYSQCFNFTCSNCARKFEEKRARRDMLEASTFGVQIGSENENWDFGAWEKSAYVDFGRQCQEFGVIIKENETKRDASRIRLTVCPGESW
ncbi:hypothetical protein ABW20_dc0108063 [Dactylellina cionopaga]|nr:hypothetical protein ABW20_dc0108063 [Dactylellina cionopaga]